MELTLSQLRQDFEQRSNKSMSMPLAGTVFWSVVLVLSLLLPFKTVLLVMLFGSGAIFPLALLFAKWRGEDLFMKANVLGKLMGVGVIMANSLWALHIPLLFAKPELVPFSLALALAIHWPLYGWIIQHKLGLQHLLMRAFGLFAAFLWLPINSITAAALVTVICYLVTLLQMHRRVADAGNTA
ncbi:DUF7010 family protein [Rheinheimera soli]|uniref:Uncharacterized protein n=1 Tax=Rheinheimera soli TaxID=443616 RepID=A0ABU1W005_9GAMM|nr:hypothetical protein [Rheinheimera soli]MDR7121053.1 hypothetical protein [Rheinheimera soli]